MVIDISEPSLGSSQRRGERFMRLPEVIERVGLKRSAIYQRMSEGRFPRSRSLGARCTIWIESEVEQWMASCARHDCKWPVDTSHD
ncbi:MAG: AlpA family transcriptional regulator [Proteobacteria bacterium]|nr:AlpA family transcriptional regulator [Pseudomonadota bacterium]